MQLSISHNRYHRQIRLKELGEEGQRKLLRAKILVIGAGGLGCPALQYLTGAGVGEIGIIDDDTVSLDNLHRQVLYRTSDIGKIKSIAAKAVLEALNPDIKIIAYPDHLNVSNCIQLFESYDIIIDGSDNFATRYMVNDACVLTGKPSVFGAVSRFAGQVAVFNAADKNGARGVNYRDLFPEPPKNGEVLNCAEMGVLGVLPGIIGVMQAGEAIKLITGIGEPLTNKMLSIDLLNNSFFEMELISNPASRSLIPATKDAFEKMNYEWLCGNYGDVNEIDIDTFKKILHTDGVVIIDVREYDELPAADFLHRQMPLSTLTQHFEEIKEKSVIFFCQAGMRSKQAAHLLGQYRGNQSKIYSLAGGIQQWIAEKKPGTNG